MVSISSPVRRYALPTTQLYDAAVDIGRSGRRNASDCSIQGRSAAATLPVAASGCGGEQCGQLERLM